MQYLLQLGRWLARAWPALMLIPVGAIHAAALILFPSEWIFVNKLFSTFLQLGGGVIVLISLDGNLGLFKQRGLAKAFILYLKDFPRPRKRAISLSGVAMGVNLGASAQLTIQRRPPSTLEERVELLERQLKEESERIRNLDASTTERLSELKTELSRSISAVDGGLSELSQKVERTALDGLKQQLFGVLLGVYGACVNVFA